MDCSLAGTTSAVCTQWNSGQDANSPGRSTETYTGTNLFADVIITDRLMNSDGTWPTSSPVLHSSSHTPILTSGTPSEYSSSTPTPTHLGTAGQTRTVSVESSSNAGGIAQVTGNAKLGLALMAAFAMV
jgi:hypothetical protein